MAITPVALGVHSSSANPVGSFASGMEFRQQVDANKLAAMRAGVELLASAGLSALNGDLNGEVNPEAWNTALDDLSKMNVPGLDIEAYRDPEMARSMAWRGMSAAQAIQAAQNEQQLELAQAQFEREIEADRAEIEALNARAAAQRNWVAQNSPSDLEAIDAGITTAEAVYERLNADSESWVTLRTPEEREAYGIPASDTRPWQVNSVTEELKLPGGSGGTTVNVGGEPLTPGWRKIDETFAPEYLSWVTGGSADTQSQLSNLNNALTLLESGAAETGNAASALPREVQAFINTDGLIARENVEEVVQRSLRETLGAQFTEREGERLIQRAFNPLLPTEENIRRARLLLTKIEEMAEAKDAMVEYFRENGTLTGYGGRAPSMNDLLSVGDQFGPDSADAPGPAPEGVPPELWEVMTPEERSAWQN